MIAIENLTNEELQDLMDEIEQEKERRKVCAKAYWEPVKKAILAYLAEVGEIKFETWDYTYYITDEVFLDQIGVINIEGQ